MEKSQIDCNPESQSRTWTGSATAWLDQIVYSKDNHNIMVAYVY